VYAWSRTGPGSRCGARRRASPATLTTSNISPSSPISPISPSISRERAARALRLQHYPQRAPAAALNAEQRQAFPSCATASCPSGGPGPVQYLEATADRVPRRTDQINRRGPRTNNHHLLVSRPLAFVFLACSGHIPSGLCAKSWAEARIGWARSWSIDERLLGTSQRTPSTRRCPWFVEDQLTRDPTRSSLSSLLPPPLHTAHSKTSSPVRLSKERDRASRPPRRFTHPGDRNHGVEPACRGCSFGSHVQ